MIGIRRRIFRFLARKIFKIPEGNKFPWYVLIIKFILSPLHSYCAFQNGIRYDLYTGTYIIEGMKYSGDLFLSWADGGMKNGQLFRMIRISTGCFAIEEVEERSVNDPKNEQAGIN